MDKSSQPPAKRSLERPELRVQEVFEDTVIDPRAVTSRAIRKDQGRAISKVVGIEFEPIDKE